MRELTPLLAETVQVDLELTAKIEWMTPLKPLVDFEKSLDQDQCSPATQLDFARQIVKSQGNGIYFRTTANPIGRGIALLRQDVCGPLTEDGYLRFIWNGEHQQFCGSFKMQFVY